MIHKMPPSTLKIVELLNDSKLHAGTEIAKNIGISRTAVWKTIQKLKKYGVPLTVQYQGYLLPRPLLLLNQQKIEEELAAFPVKVEIFESLPSTSDYLKDRLPLNETKLCLSEHQSKGRGRLGRTWASPFGRNIYCSFTYLFHQDASEISGLSLVIGVLIVKALEALFPQLSPFLKWPNDIYLEGKKAGGVLIELVAEAHGTCTAIISFGLNVNMGGIEKDPIDQPWTSLDQSLGETLDRNRIVGESLGFIFKGLDLCKSQGFSFFLNEWNRYDMLQGREISVKTGNRIVTGTSKGITLQGHLLLDSPSGERHQISSGEATLLKI